MKVFEYGQENPLVVVLLHGGGLSWWNYKDEIEILKDKYHVVVPILDGHADSDCDFTSIENNAKEIRQFLYDKFGKSVFAIGGLSLGGQILVEMLSQDADICKKAVIESALVKPMRTTNSMISPMIKMSYGLIPKQWFAKLQFAQLRIKPQLFQDYYADTCKITRSNMISFLKCNSSYKMKDTLKNTRAKVIIAVGGREQKIMKDSANILHETIPQSEMILFPDYYHGELSLSHAKEYIALFDSIKLQN